MVIYDYGHLCGRSQEDGCPKREVAIGRDFFDHTLVCGAFRLARHAFAHACLWIWSARFRMQG
jgi:hypothetical protein